MKAGAMKLVKMLLYDLRLTWLKINLSNYFSQNLRKLKGKAWVLIGNQQDGVTINAIPISNYLYYPFSTCLWI
jgi:hypothetical protein